MIVLNRGYHDGIGFFSIEACEQKNYVSARLIATEVELSRTEVKKQDDFFTYEKTEEGVIIAVDTKIFVHFRGTILVNTFF